MKTYSIILAFVAVICSSCNFDMMIGQTNGNGNVVTEERAVNADFEVVRGSAGLDIYLSEGTENKIVVEADENLLDIIETEIDDEKLHITVQRGKNIGRSKAKKVYVTYKALAGVEASSGADVVVNSVLKNENLYLRSSSGADLNAEVFTKDLTARSSSGSDLHISGKAVNLESKASSGSRIDAKKLELVNCTADVSSGADIIVNVKEVLNAEASSGGQVKYYGNPTSVLKDDGHSGSVKKM